MANNKATRKAAKKAVGSIRRAVLYARVSTDEQANGYSLETQLAACRKYAVQHSLVIVGEFQDDFTGTVPIEMRPEGKKAFTMLKQDEADVLVCYTIDRLVRPPEDGDEWDLPILIRGLAKLNKELHTVDRGKRDTSFAGLLIAMLDAKSAGDERRKIIERTARGRNAKAQNGIPPCTGFAPYGYRYTKSDASLKANDNVIIFEPEAQVVRLIYKWYTQGDESGKRLNINAIGKKLTAMGIATPTARTRPRTRADGVWEYSTLNYILTNEIYAGVLRFGKKRGRYGKCGDRPVEEQIPVAVPAIISREVWEQAQRQRESNRKESTRHAKRFYILRGRIECSCGHSMSGQARGHGYWSYRCCKTMGKYYPGLEPRNCSQKQLDGRKLEFAAWEFTLDVLTDREFFEQALLDAQAKQAEQAQPRRERLDLVLTMIGECEQNAAKLAAAIAGQVNKNGIVGQALQRQADDLDAQYRKLINERNRLSAELAADNLTQEDIDRDLHLRDDVMLGLQNPTPEIMMRAFEVIDLHVKVIEGDKVRLTCRRPVDNRVIDINTPGGIHISYTRWIELERQVDLATILLGKHER